MASSYFMLKIIERKRIARRKKQTLQEVKNTEKLIHTDSVKRCRICLNGGSIPIYGESGSHLLENIKTFGNIEISENDGFPQFLCDSCQSLLQSAVLFRSTAKESDEFLHQRVTPLIDTELKSELSDDDGRIDETLEKYSCKLCKLNFMSSEDYIAHNNSKQHRNVRIQCPICHGLLTAQLYERHLARHQSPSHLICEVCGKMYRKDNLVRHLQLHSHELPFQCKVCPYRGRFMESLKIHMRTHTGNKPFSCDTCPLRFLTRSNLNRHLVTHKRDRSGEQNDRSHKCIECNRGFYTKRDLNVHFLSDHSGIKDHVCKTCGNKYGTRKALMRHELRVHKRMKMAKGRMPLYLQDEYRKTC